MSDQEEENIKPENNETKTVITSKTGQSSSRRKQKEENFDLKLHPGFAICLILFVFIIVDVFLCGFQFRIADMRWSKVGGYRLIAVLSVIQVVLAFSITIFGFFSFKTLQGLPVVKIIF